MMMRHKNCDNRKVAGRAKKIVSVQQILEWAFGKEHARIATDPREQIGLLNPCGIDSVWILMQRKAMGAKIDGGLGPFGGSMPHDDAEIVAAIVENLPSERGGLRMALRIAELARAGITPDWMPEARPRVVPREWRQCKHGVFAKTEVVDTVKYRHRGRVVKRDVLACPVTYHPTAQKIAAARRDYLDWWGALFDISMSLRAISFRDHLVSDVMPPRNPWDRGTIFQEDRRDRCRRQNIGA